MIKLAIWSQQSIWIQILIFFPISYDSKIYVDIKVLNTLCIKKINAKQTIDAILQIQNPVATQYIETKYFYCYLYQNKLVILREGVETWHAFGEFHDLLHRRCHAERDVIPNLGHHIRHLVGGGAGAAAGARPGLLAAAAYIPHALLALQSKQTIN